MKGKYKIIVDSEYGYVRVDPIPTQEEVEHFYKEEFYSTNAAKFNDSSLEVQQEEQEFFFSRWELMYKKFSAYYAKKEGLSLFDIGFGFAQALLFFKDKGIEVSGLEPSPEGVDFARSKGLNVFECGIEDLSCVGDRRFDIVTVLNVLEHLRNPVEIIKDIKAKLLKPGGMLIIDVPNEFNDLQNIANEEYGLNEWWVCPPAHINYFSSSSIQQVLRRCGYSIWDYQSSFPLELFMLLGDVYVGNNELGKACHNKRVHFEYLMRKHKKEDKLYQFYKALADLNLGRDIVVFAIAE